MDVQNIPHRVRVNLEMVLFPAYAVAGALSTARRKDQERAGHGRYVWHVMSCHGAELRAMFAKIQERLDSIPCPKNRALAGYFIECVLPDLSLSTQEQKWFTESGREEIRQMFFKNA